MPSFTIPRTRYVDTRLIARNFSIAAGDDTTVVFTLIAADALPVVPINITGAAVTFRARPRNAGRGCPDYGFPTDRSRAEIEKAVGAGIVLTTPASGVLTVTFAEADTANLSPGPYAWQLRVTLASAAVVRASGTMIIDSLIEAR